MKNGGVYEGEWKNGLRVKFYILNLKRMDMANISGQIKVIMKVSGLKIK